MKAYRIQDADGRGPFKPGFSRYWADLTFDRPTDILSAFGNTEWRQKIPAGWHCGCATRSIIDIDRWFSPNEQNILRRMGYALVEIDVDLVIAENADQMIVATRLPFTVGRPVEHMVFA